MEVLTVHLTATQRTELLEAMTEQASSPLAEPLITDVHVLTRTLNRNPTASLLPVLHRSLIDARRKLCEHLLATVPPERGGQ